MRSQFIRVTAEIAAALTFLILPLMLLPVVSPLDTSGTLQPVLKGVLIIHGALIAFYYWNFYFAIPRLFFAGKRKTYAITTLAILALLVLAVMTDEGYNPFPDPPFRYPKFIFIMSVIVRFMMVLFISFAIASIVRLRKAEEEGLRSELSFLKAQINPHFLFNTLNSIYALAVSKSDKGPAAITRLAAIMRYVIDESSADLVPLEKELSYTAAYLELEKLRLNEKVRLEYTVSGSATAKYIPPLILLPLIENAFKHGVSANSDCKISISIGISDRHLSLHVKNARFPGSGERQGGVGLANVRKRLSLLTGPQNKLSIDKNDQYFSAHLQLALT